MSHTRPLALRLALVATTLASHAGFATAQFQDGDIFLNKFNVTTSSLEHLTADGSSLMSAGGAGGMWLGVVITANGLLGTTQRTTNEVLLFDSAGAQVLSFPLSAGSSNPGDLDAFQDGTLAVVDQGGDVDLYSESGTYQTTFTHPQLVLPFGCHVDDQDHLWVCDPAASGLILEFDRQGAVQQVITTTHFDPGDLVTDDDGSLWVTGRDNNMVYHLDSAGAILSSFATTVLGSLSGIALRQDGTLLLTGEGDNQVHRYTKQGVELATFASPGTGSPIFLIVTDSGGLGTRYCFGDGTALACPCGNAGGTNEGCANSTTVGATLIASGSTSAPLDSLEFSAAQLTPDQPALLFSALNAVQGGNGAFFGDGLRCAGGEVKRLGVMTANSTGDATWGPSLASAGGWQGGDIRRFQVWYRDPVGGPCGTGFNLTNGVEISFAP